MEPRVEHKSLRCADGYLLKYSHYHSTESKAVVIFASALGVSRQYYHRLAVYLCQQGYDCFSFDYRGTGEQDAPLAKDAAIEHWGQRDIEAMIQQALNLNLSVHFIGHSIGGQLLGLAPSASKLRSVMLVAASAPYWKRWEGSERLKLLFLSYVLIPVLGALKDPFPIAALGLGNIRMPSRFIKRWAEWMREPDYLLAPMFKLDRSGYENISCRLWTLGFRDDELAPEINIRHLSGFYSKAKVSLDMLDPAQEGLSHIGHNGLFHKRSEEALWPKVLNYLSEID
ncbi:alpha/beta fold hydrolase [Pseudoteredinibacter isoporae]|uniref:Putative alpha/beta hydrolase n=2 Tax=Pseudoteredinibacter isoporae TaxID=570281 RepID=A0A7X0MVQ9_9GAMM|nr:alpha/beta fold hydrolase [Pseudoteredinibacter isoporae]MBB6521385.1 putative alpha/beta hydrolase [Pseudoteredinibacter isoporae]NHO86940.1 alpha/beta fold hydrolase [Pseudoteredinibacter isoporae]NIB24607.1 alpha/beta fold hydrolase [Pseudoteredinibacter isoporae]